MAESTHVPLTQVLLKPLELPSSNAGLLLSLGYEARAGAGRLIPESIRDSIEEGRRLIEPRASYATFGARVTSAGKLALGGREFEGKIAEFLAGAAQVTAFVVTVGARISDEARDASRRGDLVRAWALEGLGSWAAEAAAEALSRDLEATLPPGWGQGPRFSPGYCGMGLEQQDVLFSLVSTREIGVILLSSQMMQPIKSISGLVGSGPHESFDPKRIPCATCPQSDCPMRR